MSALLDARTQRTVQAGMVAFLSLVAFEGLAVSTAMPAVAADLDGLRLYTYAFSAASAASVAGMLAAGRWTDRSGPTPPMWTGVALFLAGVVVVGLAPTMAVLIGGRLLQGVGGGLTGVALYVLVARVFPSDRHPKVLAVFAAAWVIPGLVGPLLAGLVTEHLGWRWVFLGVPLLALPALAWLRPGLAAARGGASGKGAVGDEHRSAPAPRVADVLRAPGLVSTVASRALVAAAFFGAEVLLPLVLVHEHGMSPALAGTVLTLSVLGWSAGSWVRGRGLHGLTHAGFLRLGGTFLAAGTAGAALLALPGVPLGVAVAPWALAGLGMGLSYPTQNLLTLELAPPGGQGTATSALNIAEAGAAAVTLAGTGALLWVIHDAVGLPAYAVCLGLATGLAACVVALAGRTRPSAGPDVTSALGETSPDENLALTRSH